jgi:type IV fimbrial biogenesis protein FimT
MSLIEMLVVLVILAVLAGIAVPNVSQWIENYTVRKAARQLVSDLQLARMKAVSQGIQHRILFDPATKTYNIQFQDPVDGQFKNTADAMRSLSDINNPYYAKGVSVADNFTSNAVTFSATGTASPAGTVTFTTANYTRLVTVILTGRIRVG